MPKKNLGDMHEKGCKKLCAGTIEKAILDSQTQAPDAAATPAAAPTRVMDKSSRKMKVRGARRDKEVLDTPKLIPAGGRVVSPILSSRRRGGGRKKRKNKTKRRKYSRKRRKSSKRRRKSSRRRH